MNKETEEKLRQLARDILKEFATAEKDEEWVPKVGDLCRVSAGLVVVKRADGRGAILYDHPNTKVEIWQGHLVYKSKPTPEEIAAHEAKLESSKAVKFGTRVDFISDSHAYQGRVAYDTPDEQGEYLITFINSDGINDWVWRNRSDFKVLDQ